MSHLVTTGSSLPIQFCHDLVSVEWIDFVCAGSGAPLQTNFGFVIHYIDYENTYRHIDGLDVAASTNGVFLRVLKPET